MRVLVFSFENRLLPPVVSSFWCVETVAYKSCFRYISFKLYSVCPKQSVIAVSISCVSEKLVDINARPIFQL